MGSVECKCCTASDGENKAEIQLVDESCQDSLEELPASVQSAFAPPELESKVDVRQVDKEVEEASPVSPDCNAATCQLLLPLVSDCIDSNGIADGIVDGVSVEEQAALLLKGLRACDAALLLEGSADETSRDQSELRAMLDMQLSSLGDALGVLGNHPGLSKLPSETGSLPEVLLGIPVPNSPSSARSQSDRSLDRLAEKSTTSISSTSTKGKRDVLEINFDLDDKGRHVEAVVEFFADGTVSLMWTAFKLPVPMPYVLCMVQEVDLLGDIAPFVKNAGVLHQFSSNEADRLIRVVSQPPIPMVAGLEAVSQRFGYDLLDTPWEAFCLVEIGPEWVDSKKDTSEGPAQKKKPVSTGQWRGVHKPPLFQKGLKEVDVKKVVALGCPVGPKGECTTILFSGKGDLKVPRWLLPNGLISWLVKLIGRFIYTRALDRVAKFDSSAHGERLRNSTFYPELYRRIEEHVKAKTGKR
jgi:hypothetical protein